MRATLENKETLPNGETVITAYYVDFGIVEVVSAKNVLLLERLSTAIDSFPVQVSSDLYKRELLLVSLFGHA